jgi:ABC-2 type transport system permease protein
VNAVGLYELMQEEGMGTDLISDTNRKVSIDLIFTALGKENFFQFKSLSQFPATTLINYYTGSFLVMAILYFGLYIGYQLLKDLKQGTLTRLRTTMTPLYQLLTAKIIVNTVALTAVVICALVLICRYTVILEMLLFSMAIAMFAICLAIFLSALLQTTQRFVLASNLIIFFITVIGGGIIPIQFLPQDMLILSKFTPYYYILKGIINLNQRQYWKIDGTTAGFFIISLSLMLLAIIMLYRRSVTYDEV